MDADLVFSFQRMRACSSSFPASLTLPEVWPKSWIGVHSPQLSCLPLLPCSPDANVDRGYSDDNDHKPWCLRLAKVVSAPCW